MTTTDLAPAFRCLRILRCLLRTWLVPNGTVVSGISPGSGPQVGSSSGEYRSPWENPSDTCTGTCATAAYYSVSGNGSAEFIFAGAPYNSLSLVWGSPDTYNRIELFDANGLVYAVYGEDSGNLPLPGASVSATEAHLDPLVSRVLAELVKLTGLPDFISAILYSDGSNAFEFANLNAFTTQGAAPVPIPPAITLFGGVIAISGFAARRKARKGIQNAA